jgi:hypothetical protein
MRRLVAHLLLACVLLCAAGMAAYATGEITQRPRLADAGEWMTAPLTVVMAVLVPVALIGLACQQLACAARTAARWFGRRRR